LWAALAGRYAAISTIAEGNIMRMTAKREGAVVLEILQGKATASAVA
jgi:hypothetical protein